MLGFYMNLILFFISLLSLLYFTYKPSKNYRFISKTITSFLFIFMALISYTHSNCDFYYFKFILMGLVCSLFGDMFLALNIHSKDGFLNRKFIYGLICFSIAHIMYVLAFINMGYFNRMDLNITLIFSLLIIFILNKYVQFKNLLGHAWVYSFLISLMSLECLKLVFSSSLNNLSSTLLLVGALLFVISDIVLSFVLFHKKPHKYLTGLNLLTYYMGQLLIAIHLFFI